LAATLLLALMVTSTLLYRTAPRDEFVFDVRNEDEAGSPARPHFERLEAKLAIDEGARITFWTASGTVSAYFARGLPRAKVTDDTLTLRPVGDEVEFYTPPGMHPGLTGAYLNEERVSLQTGSERLKEYRRDSHAARFPPKVIHAPPECSLLQWAEFLRMPEEDVYYHVSMP